MINQWGKMEKQDPLIHPETGNEIQKCFYISVPYFPGLSESFKKIFKYTPVQVCFKGVNTLKSMLMHPKDKISNDQKKDLVYHWECKADGCNSSYIGETSRALGKRVKEHSKSTTSAILKHCKDFHHPLPSIEDFNIIDKEPLSSHQRGQGGNPHQTARPQPQQGILVKCPSLTALIIY